MPKDSMNNIFYQKISLNIDKYKKGVLEKYYIYYLLEIKEFKLFKIYLFN